QAAPCRLSATVGRLPASPEVPGGDTGRRWSGGFLLVADPVHLRLCERLAQQPAEMLARSPGVAAEMPALPADAERPPAICREPAGHHRPKAGVQPPADRFGQAFDRLRDPGAAV